MKNNIELPTKSKIRSTIATILLSFVIFLLFILTLEIVLRTTHLFGARVSWTEKDIVLGYRFVPHAKYWAYKENDHPIVGRMNSFGWRDKEWSLKKPRNTYRIAVLGDSFVEAIEVESDRTFLALTEHNLNENYKLTVELMNFGLSGYTQTEELLVLKNHVAQFFPDMVILFFYPGNDIGDVSKETTASGVLRPFFNISQKGELILDTSFVNLSRFKHNLGLTQHSALISLINERYIGYQEQRQNKAQDISSVKKTDTLRKHLTLCTTYKDTIYVKNYQLNKRLIKAMAEYCKEKGIQFMLVTLDTDAYIPEVEKRYKAIDPTFDANYFEEDLKDFAISLNIEYLGLQRIFRQAYQNTSVPLHWGHWNYEGHKVVSNALTDKLKFIVPSAER